ncbi:energy-coupling factor transporter ATPase [Limosilactobacillus equigenerosi]|nr:energy-coupling factor transporter ATPase [Limosilactobacillus equigenerosi]
MALVEVKDVTYQYPEAVKPSLEQVNLTIEPGEWVALIGQNGSGKSTLARLIDGLLPLTSGTITVGGIPVDEQHLNAIHQQIGMVFQNPDNQFVGATVADDLAFGLENHLLDRDVMQRLIPQWLKKVGMQKFVASQPEQLSGGQKQRVALAGAMVLSPQLLILDEATSMLDPVGRQEVMATITELRRTQALAILSITHDVNEALLADRVVLMDQGKVVASGQPQVILGDPALATQYQFDQPPVAQLKAALAMHQIQVPTQITTQGEMQTWLRRQFNSKR